MVENYVFQTNNFALKKVHKLPFLKNSPILIEVGAKRAYSHVLKVLLKFFVRHPPLTIISNLNVQFA